MPSKKLNVKINRAADKRIPSHVSLKPWTEDIELLDLITADSWSRWVNNNDIP